ncbi:chemotaxis protein CheD [uncultured Sphaerotilus sp.]|uniref:chemotaxis protein CheD n=1 Tax=uncultured Sphaerotilus sp. TaxID=474984 RepID=UPI0030CA5B1B
MTAQHVRRVVTLHPGDVALGLRGDRLETLLGSCVAIVLTDPRRTVGTMCHIVTSRPATTMRTASGAQADVALQTMERLLQSRGFVAARCEAYVFGGGNMFPGLVSGPSVGDANVQWAERALAELGTRVLSVDVGGHVYRRLRWTVGPQAPQVEAVPL